MMPNTYKITKRYYDDHVECDCEAPAIIKSTKRHYFISAEETDEMAEFRSRCAFYAEPNIDADSPHLLGIVSSARATLKVIGEQPVEDQHRNF